MMDIAFCVNSTGLEGFGATLVSIIRNCPNQEQLKFWIFHTDIQVKDIENTRQLLHQEKFRGDVQFVSFDAKKLFGQFRSLHGDWTTYGRLLIADHVQADDVLYLDADLVVVSDVFTFKNYKLNDHLLGAVVYDAHVKTTLDKSFFLDKLNWNPELPYFNAGILLLNLKKWRAENIRSQIFSLAETYPNDLISHDQTLLNAICKGHFLQLDKVCNQPWYPGEAFKGNITTGIIHFVGSPKPWDLFGPIIHSGYKLWRTYNIDSWQKSYSKLNSKKTSRALKLKKSYLKALKSNMLKK